MGSRRRLADRKRQAQSFRLSIPKRIATTRYGTDAAPIVTKTYSSIELLVPALMKSSEGLLLPDPEIPEYPSQDRPCAAPADHRHGRDTFLEDDDEAAHEDRD